MVAAVTGPGQLDLHSLKKTSNKGACMDPKNRFIAGGISGIGLDSLNRSVVITMILGLVGEATETLRRYLAFIVLFVS
jgi:hypothetical protein